MSARAIAKTVGVALAGSAGAARAESRPKYGSALEATLLGAPGTFDPQAAQTHAEQTIADLVFDTLYRVDPAGVVWPQLAAALPELDAARTTATIAIRRAVRFHDGTPLTAQDVAASLERLRTGPARWPLAAVASVRAVGDTVELTLRAPVAELASLLALPQAAVTKGGKPPGERSFVGTGAFLIESIDARGKQLVLRAFEDHFAGRPYLDHLVLRWFDTTDGEARRFETGLAQLSARGVGAFASSRPKYRADDVEGPAALLVFVGFGAAHAEVTADPAFRAALDLALARDPLRSVSSGERVSPTREPVPVEAGGAGLSPVARFGDLSAARLALADAARRVKALAPSRLPQLRLEILVEATRPDDVQIAERVVHALDKLDLAATIKPVSIGELRDRVARGACDLWIGQLAMPVRSAPLWWSAAFAAGGEGATAQAIAAGTLAPAAAHRLFDQKKPILPLMFRALRLWHRTDVRGLRLDATGRPSFGDVFLFGEPVLGKPGARPARKP
ncbi:MAG: ABC transporter substrate-binding protein [Kofleriaceae bacterium]